MSDAREQEIIHNLILARELRRQGPSWNRAFRRELWRRVASPESMRASKARRIRTDGQ
jgi:hypothetical protein